MMKQMIGSMTMTAALGLGTLVLRPADWWPWVRRTYVAAPGLLAGGVAGALLLVDSPPGEKPAPDDTGLFGNGRLRHARSLPVVARLALALGFGSIVAAMQVGSLRADRGVERWLSRRGLEHPRRWMAATVVAMSLAKDVGEARDAAAGTAGDPS